MFMKFNVDITLSGLSVVTDSKRFFNGVVEKESHEDNHLDELSINVEGGCELEASETKEFILGIVDAVKTAAEVKMAQQQSKPEVPSEEKKADPDEVAIKEDDKNV